jgi:ABC-type polysaccharide/polyol phosphate transport system ATPase subunit
VTTVVSCEAVSKRFEVPMRAERTLRGRILHPFSRSTIRRFDALQDVSFAVEQGEFFGIIGRNGSGKSTMLKILAGIYTVDSGRVDVRGSLAPFIELGVGFNFELSGRDNVFLNGALLGLSKRDLQRRYESIVRFAELEDFMDLKLANYSSGMQVRLAFAIAVESDADILLIDEVLAVGDERFQRKCFDVFRARKAAGKTVVFVSHDMGAIREFCDRAVLLEEGRVVDIGGAHEVAESYFKLNLPEKAEQRKLGFDQGWIEDVEIAPAVRDGDDVPVVQHGERLQLSMTVRPKQDVASPSFGFIVHERRGRSVVASNTNFMSERPSPLRAGETVRIEFEFDNWISAGDYFVMATLEDEDQADPLDIRRDAIVFRVESPASAGAILEVPPTFTVRPVATDHATR